jgi:phage host-nuclease inhibitor protein Gam
MKSSNSSASAFGWGFQSNAAIMLMLKYITTATSVKVEGDTEDIEIYLSNEKMICSQAKSVFKPDDYSNVIAKLQASLKTLNNAANAKNIDKLIYVTNSPNPFNETQTMYAFSGSLTTLSYDELPDLCKNKIEKLCKKHGYTFSRDLLFIYVMQFHGDGDNRFKVIKDLTNEFLEYIGVGDRGLGARMLDYWQNIFSNNATSHNFSAKISKEQMIWPIIVSICRVDRNDAECAECDDGDFEEIERRYSAIINNKTERFEFITKVLSEYVQYKCNQGMQSKQKTQEFLAVCWSNFQDEFHATNMNTTILEKITKIALANIIRSRNSINNLKEKVNL